MDFFKSLKFDINSIKQYRIEAALEAYKLLGNKPALCFSGGVDSQAMVQCWEEANLSYDLYILVFKNNLNSQDINHAINYCKQYNITPKIIELDILQFLNRENFQYGLQYDSASPHFNTHYKMFNIIKEYGNTGVCCGGNTPIKNINDDTWGMNFNRNPLNFIVYSKKTEFPCLGNFLSFYPKLAWSLSLLTPPIDLLQETHANFRQVDRDWKENERYRNKCFGYQRAGFKIKPQTQKFTGFELVKAHLEINTNNGWEFEQRYRHPLEKILNHTTGKPVFEFRPNVKQTIELLYSNNLASGVGSSSGI